MTKGISSGRADEGGAGFVNKGVLNVHLFIQVCIKCVSVECV